MGKKREVYSTCEANGREYAERIADMHRKPGKKVTVEHTEIPMWGSAIPTSNTFGKSEMGYRITVEDE